MSNRKVPARNHEELLVRIGEELDIPESKYEDAVRSYESLGAWLDRDESALSGFEPAIGPQGSMLLGTVIKPIGGVDDYDVDLVCTLKASKSNLSQQALKKLVGDEIRLYAKSQGMKNEPVEGRRCWKLEYSDGSQFHMDVLPAIPDSIRYRKRLIGAGYAELSGNEAFMKNALAITDNKTATYLIISDDWPSSNPFGYAAWFRERMSVRLRLLKEAYAKSQIVTASVDEIPDYKVKTPLQRSIQLLKRHRDYMFGRDGEHKPISIIITTLAALAYNNEETISETLRTVLRGMESHIERRRGAVWIPNPVNPLENYADKWADTPEKEENFFKWIEQAKRDFGTYLQVNEFDNVPGNLRGAFGAKLIDRVLESGEGVGESKSLDNRVARATVIADRIQREGGGSKPWVR